MKKVRYAVVGAGWISQEAFMPAVAQTGNSEMVAIVTGNSDTAAKLAAFHGVPETCGYDGYDALLASGRVDAVYIALPNSMHADFAIRAAKAGIHAMVEKPLAVTVAECQAMIDAAKAGGVHLMTAYRLHTEPGTIDVIDRIRQGEIGDPRIFTSVFSFQSGPDNHRLKADHWGGPLQDIGVYCLNAARHVFGAEPVEVTAMQTFGTDARSAEVAEMVTATLRFPGGRLATVTVSFNGADNDWYRVTGTKGEIVMDPGFRFETPMRAVIRHRRQDDGRNLPLGRSLRRPDRIFLGLHPGRHAARTRRSRGAGRRPDHARHRTGGDNRNHGQDRPAPATRASGPQHAAVGPEDDAQTGAVAAGQPALSRCRRARCASREPDCGPSRSSRVRCAVPLSDIGYV